MVDKTQQGYITKGDANPFTDQDAAEPPVLRTRIVAEALKINGEVVVIPEFGTAVLAVQDAFQSVVGPLSGVPGLAVLLDGGFGSVLIGLGLFILGLSFVGDLLRGGRRARSRDRSREGMLSAFLLLVLIIALITVPATASMVIPSGTNEIQIISSQAPSGDPYVIRSGGSREITYNGSAVGVLPRMVILDPASEGVTVSDPVLQMAPGATSSTSVTISAPNATGMYVRAISERHYVQVLPASVIVSLHYVHPWLAIFAINLFLTILVTVIFVSTVGLGPIRLRSRGRDVSLADRLRRMLP